MRIIIMMGIFLSLSLGKLSAQHMLGVSTSNYAGTNGTIANPSYAADSRHGFYLNLFSGNAYGTNTYYMWDGPSSPFQFLIKGEKFDESYLKKDTNGKPSLVNIGADLRGPSFLLKLNAKSGIAFHTRFRAAIQGNNISANFAQLLNEGIDEDELVDQNFTDNTFAMNVNAFTEIGFTYGRTVWESDQHFLKAGLTVKRLIGSYSAHFMSSAMDFTVRDGETVEDYYLEVAKINAKYGYSTDEEFEDVLNPLDSESKGAGWGFDFGVVYEHRRDIEQYRYTMDGIEKLDNGKNKYDYKIGLSILDIGSIKYDSEFARVYAFERHNTNISEEDLDNLDGEFVDVFNDIFDITPNEGSNSFKSGLPTALRAEFDYRLAKKIYANLTVFQNLKGKDAIGMRQFSMVALTPRIEMKALELAIPIVLMNDYKNLALGTSLRLGNIFVGSDNLASTFGLGKSTGADVYFGLSIPILKKKKKDKDKDGVSNRKDICKNIAGKWEFKGCPDTDNDGVEDKLDKCPTVFGLAEFAGCPDTDGDGVQDSEDACPQEAGLATLKGCPDMDGDGIEDHLDECKEMAGLPELNGCPDTDGDGIADINDACPEHAGPVENKGCPDADGDGVADHLDECADVKGLVQFKGCPDTDEDGFPDHSDSCPELYGDAETGGCPKEMEIGN